VKKKFRQETKVKIIITISKVNERKKMQQHKKNQFTGKLGTASSVKP